MIPAACRGADADADAHPRVRVIGTMHDTSLFSGTCRGPRLDRPVINLGFGANGEMEVSVGRLIVELKQAALIVIDCSWNMAPDQIRANAPVLVRQFRQSWSATKPILLAEGTSAGAAWFQPAIAAMQAARRAALASAFAELTAAGVPNLHYQKGDELIGISGKADLPTAMGTHPTDLGHSMIAKHYAKLIPTLLHGGGVVHSSVVHSSSSVPPPAVVSRFGEAVTTAGECPPIDGFSPPTNVEAAEIEVRNAQPFDRDSVAWTDAKTLSVGGREDWGGLPRENFYDRFPLAAKADVNAAHKSIWGLSKCSSGEYIGFKIEGDVSQLFVCFNNTDSSGRNPSGGRLSIMWVGTTKERQLAVGTGRGLAQGLAACVFVCEGARSFYPPPRPPRAGTNAFVLQTCSSMRDGHRCNRSTHLRLPVRTICLTNTQGRRLAERGSISTARTSRLGPGSGRPTPWVHPPTIPSVVR